MLYSYRASGKKRRKRNEKEMKESEKTNMQLKQSLICIILLAAGVIMVLFGVLRGEAGIVLAKAIRLCLECVGIG